MKQARRDFIRHAGYTSAGLLIFSQFPYCSSPQSTEQDQNSEDTNSTSSTQESDIQTVELKISLAQWSLHKQIFDEGMDNLDFPKVAKEQFGIEAVEFVNQFFADKAEDAAYLSDLKTRCDDHGVKPLLIMIDNEGHMGALDDTLRAEAVTNHFKWVEAAKTLGCHSIRVNAGGEGSREDVSTAAIDALGKLSEFAQKAGINILVENHGGYSSDGQWLSNIITQVGMDNCGTLPDFGNFTIDKEKNEVYDRYQGMQELLPFAKGVSAKSYDFDENGNETTIDFTRMLDLVRKSGFSGYVGVEYEGENLPEAEGIQKTKALLEKAIQETA